MKGFEWDDDKATRNLRTHDVGFDEAATAFNDPARVELLDESHSDEEPRYAIIGFSNAGRLLFVIFTMRHNVTRLISARKANKKHQSIYEKENKV